MKIRYSVESSKTRLLLGIVLAGNLSIAAGAWAITGLHHRNQDKQTRKTTDPPMAAKGKLGQDLFLAIDHRSVAEVKDLISKGADPNSRNGLEFTPLFIASASYQMDVMGELLKAGADADAESNYGTPLMFAAATGNTFGANILYTKNVNVNAQRNDGMTVLMMASYSGNPEFVADLIKRKADVATKDDNGANALMYAARAGNDKVGEILLGSGIESDGFDNDHMTPLMEAAKSGHTNFVKLLLAKGANVNAKNKGGETPLLLAAKYGDNPDTVKALLAGGANPKVSDSSGKAAATYASERGYLASARLLGAKNKSGSASPTKLAIKRSLSLIQSSMLDFNKSTACLSCHQEGLGRIATGMAADHGFKLDPAVQQAQIGRVNGAINAMKPLHEGALKNPEVMKQVPLIEINEVTTMYPWLLSGMAAHRQAPSAASTAMVEVLARQQSKNGAWTLSLPRTPMQSSPFTFTALTVRSMKAYSPKSDAAKTASQISMAREWMMQTPAKSSEDRASKLLGLKWASASNSALTVAASEIRKDQRPDGGWSQLPNLQSDAYATGQALYALHEAGGMSVTDPTYKRGVAYLLRTQDSDGSWFVNKRAIPANNYFHAGFPHGQSQYSSFNGSCWAMMALLETL